MPPLRIYCYTCQKRIDHGTRKYILHRNSSTHLAVLNHHVNPFGNTTPDPTIYLCYKCQRKFDRLESNVSGISSQLQLSHAGLNLNTQQQTEIQQPELTEYLPYTSTPIVAPPVGNLQVNLAPHNASCNAIQQVNLPICPALPPQPSSLQQSNAPSPQRQLYVAPQVQFAGEVMNISVIASSESCCCICGSLSGRSKVPVEVVAYTWASHKIFIPFTNRICPDHVDMNQLLPEVLTALHTRSQTATVPTNEIFRLMNELALIVTRCQQKQNCISFDSQFCDLSQYHTLLGVSMETFNDIFAYAQPYIHDSSNRSPRNALAIFLMKLRTNNSQEQLAALFGLSQQRVSDIIDRVCLILDTYFVPRFLGYRHISKGNLTLLHNTVLSTVLTRTDPSQTVVVMDGTYFYIQKSSNFELQKLTYSGQKKRNLVKGMVICAPDGYILEVEGLYMSDGHNNDASILNSLLSDHTSFDEFFSDGRATMVVDRGFRDSVILAESLGYQVAMTNLLRLKQKQFRCEEANESRLVTKVRWVVESVNGRLKNVFRFFRDVIPNLYLEGGKLQRLMRVACAILNAYFPVLAKEKPGDAELARYMIERSDLCNLLEARLNEENLIRKRVIWIPANDSDFPDFPVLSYDDLQNITVGIFQLKIAPSYLSRLRDSQARSSTEAIENGHISLWYYRDDPTLLRFRMPSRFVSGEHHQLWIHFEPNSTRGRSSILGWYCQCKSGARIVGRCAHVACILWYLSNARHLPQIRRPAHTLGNSLLNARMGYQAVRQEDERIPVHNPLSTDPLGLASPVSAFSNSAPTSPLRQIHPALRPSSCDPTAISRLCASMTPPHQLHPALLPYSSPQPSTSRYNIEFWA